jgi:HSP20 family protein
MPKDMIRLMHALFLPAVQSARQALWCPAADVYRTRKGWLVKFDLAGVRPEDIDLEVQGRRMRVRGVRRDCATEEGCRYYLMEISYSNFERVLELPCDLQRAEISTDYRDGMLLVHINPEVPGESQ